MYSIHLSENVVIRHVLLNKTKILPHEHVVKDRLKTLVEYIRTLDPYAILPAIIVCNKTNVIIDGHHRYYALLEIGFSDIPVVLINYDSELIIPELDKSISKKDIIDAGVSGRLLEPKSSFHHIVDIYGKPHPLILISPLSDFKLNNETNNTRP
jgi:L-serine kinase (ADP)